MTRKRRASAGGTAALWVFIFAAIATGMLLLGQPSWLFLLFVGVVSYLAASRRTRAGKRRRQAELPPAYEIVPVPKPSRPARRRRVKVPVAQFDEKGRTPLERALHGDDAAEQ